MRIADTSETDTPAAPLAESESDTSETPVATPALLPHDLRTALLPLAAFVIVGLLVGLRVAAQAMLPHIVQPGDYVNYQSAVDGLPVPHVLNWDAEQLDTLMTLRDLSGVSLPLTIVFVFGPLWLLLVRRVNPTFRLFGHAPLTSFPPSTPANSLPVDAPADAPVAIPADVAAPGVPPVTTAGSARVTASAALSTPLEFYGLVKACTLLIVMGLPLAAVWILADWDDTLPPRNNLAPGAQYLVGSVWALRLVLLGIAFWTGFHRDGVAGDFTRPEWNPSRRALPRLAWRGVAFGLIAFGLARFGLPQNLEDTLLRLQTLGGFNSITWSLVSTRLLLSFGLVWFAAGCLFVFLSPPPKARSHAILLLLPLAACLLAVFAQRGLMPQALASRYDIRPAVLQIIPENQRYRPDAPNSGIPDGAPAASELARLTHLPPPASAVTSGRTLVLFDEPRFLLTWQNDITLDGLAPTPEASAKITDFLKQREYQTALSWIATKTLFNIPLVHLDTTGAIRASLLDLTHYPHNAQFAPTLQSMFAICAATPENEALLDEWADESRFAFPDRESRRLMGDLYRRFGSPEKALRWYRKADMPSSFLTRVRAERPMYRTGYIQGVLHWNGRPLVGAQVAVVPARMNGLPLGQELPVSHALEGMLNLDARFHPALFPPYHPYPFQLRWISAAATTDSRGAYRIDHLTEGTYTALCTLPNGVQTTLPFDTRLQITHPIPPFNLSYHQKGYDMGTTEFKWSESESRE